MKKVVRGFGTLDSEPRSRIAVVDADTFGDILAAWGLPAAEGEIERAPSHRYSHKAALGERAPLRTIRRPQLKGGWAIHLEILRSSSPGALRAEALEVSQLATSPMKHRAQHTPPLGPLAGRCIGCSFSAEAAR
eukprot:347077-Amphidinium_carterae.1